MIINKKILKKYYQPLLVFITIGIVCYFILFMKVIKNNSHFDKKTLNIDNIKTGDLFLLSYSRKIHLFFNALLGMNFVHPSIAVWENGKLFMLEYADYTDSYEGFVKIPFQEWIRFNRKSVILKNSLSIRNDSERERENLSSKLLDIYYSYKEKFNNFEGNFNPDMYRFFLRRNNYRSVEEYNNITCTEVLAFLICESGIAKKTKSLEYYQPSKFVGFSGFDFKDKFYCEENYIIEMK